jgi:predicted MFS family arabinose efflux permease
MLFSLGSGFWSFFPSIILFAVGMALISGAPGSWLIGQLIKKGAYEKMGEIIPKAQTVIKLFSIIAALISFVLINYSDELTILVAGGLVIFAGVIGLFIGEDNFGDTTDTKIHKIVQNSIKNFIKSKYLLLMALKTVIGYISFTAFILYWQIYATEYVNIGTKYLSATLVVFMVALMLGNYVASKLSKKSPVFIVVLIGYLICLIGYILLIVNMNNSIILFILGAFVIELGFGTEQASTFVWLNNYFDNNIRATYNSLFSTIESVFGFLIINILGIVGEKFGIRTIWITSAISIIFTIFIIIYLNRITTSERKSM